MIADRGTVHGGGDGPRARRRRRRDRIPRCAGSNARDRPRPSPAGADRGRRLAEPDRDRRDPHRRGHPVRAARRRHRRGSCCRTDRSSGENAAGVDRLDAAAPAASQSRPRTPPGAAAAGVSPEVRLRRAPSPPNSPTTPDPFHAAHLLELDDDLLAVTGLPPPAGPPVSVLYSPGVRGRIGLPTRDDRGGAIGPRVTSRFPGPVVADLIGQRCTPLPTAALVEATRRTSGPERAGPVRDYPLNVPGLQHVVGAASQQCLMDGLAQRAC